MRDYREILKEYWGYDDFRGIQREIIESIGNGHDTLGLMPTGGGKSITFQVPALAQEGVCLVVTPLIALMKDQVDHLRHRGIRAAAIYSGCSHEEIVITLENCILGHTKLLYVSPERLNSELFQTKIKKTKVSFITVDEAHCISQWGYDFRPSYLEIANLRKLLPHVPVLALTATATPHVVQDIQERLMSADRKLEEGTGFNVYRMSFERENLTYIVRRAPDKYAEMAHILSSIEGSAIVYVRSRKRSKEIATFLSDQGLKATFYHAGLNHEVKDERQQLWQRDEVRIMVATNAFGMGIDKADVRVVLHIDCPDSIEAYFQEAGRAGRDGKQAYAVLLFNNHDFQKLTKRIEDTFPPQEFIREVYEHLAYYYQIGVGSGYHASFEFSMDEFCKRFRHFPIQVDAALKILTRAGYIEYTEEQESQARVMFTIKRDELYRLQQNSPEEEKVVVALLRNYGGLFSEYNYIDEGLIAQQAGLTRQQVYLILKSLGQRHILHFIPQSRTPYIRYQQRREDAHLLVFKPDVYQERKKQYQQRIKAITHYLQNDRICRSRQLLRYFGERNEHNCGKCDVCRSSVKISDERLDALTQQVLQLLSDQASHHVSELNHLNIDSEELDAVLSYLLLEEIIYQTDGYIIKA